jgi:hypothetical protein
MRAKVPLSAPELSVSEPAGTAQLIAANDR